MTDPVDTLLDLINIERLENDLFRGQGEGGETRKRIFGGQVVAQALAAAYQTVDARPCHSLHAYFLRPGDPSIPVIYEVDRARDGGSFTTRRVVAIQNGRQIFNMAASFHQTEEGPSHYHAMRPAPGPDTLSDRSAERQRIANMMPEPVRSDILRPSAIQIREADPINWVAPEPTDDRCGVWFRLARPVADLAPWQHHCLMAYASDMYLLGAALRPMGESFLTGRVMTASLDHALWLHGPLDFNTWHFYAMESPFVGGGRGLCRGAIYDQDGRLVASSAQEGLVRPITPRPDA